MNLIKLLTKNIQFNHINSNVIKKSIYTTCKQSTAVKLAFNVYDTRNDTNVQSLSATSPIVILHGLFGSKQNWKSISRAINARSNPQRKVFTLDARNHGDSEHSPNHTYEDLSEDIMEFFKQNNISKSIVIGHSMGGRAMMCLALKYPELVEKAIIVDISPVTHSPSLDRLGNLFAAMKSIKLPNDIKMSKARELADEQLKLSVPETVTREFILMNLIKGADGNFSWKVNVESLHNNFQQHIATFPEHLTKNQYIGPVLFIGGSKSDYIKESEMTDIQRIFPNASIEFIDTGHLVHIENPNEFMTKVLRFIDINKT